MSQSATAEPGGEAESAGGAEQTSGQTISPAVIAKYKPGTPENTTLTWWRAVQTNDPNTAIPLYVEPPTLPNLAGQFNVVGDGLAGTVKVTSTKKTGPTADVNVTWTDSSGESTPETLQLEEVGGEWKIANTRFLDKMVQEIQEEE